MTSSESEEMKGDNHDAHHQARRQGALRGDVQPQTGAQVADQGGDGEGGKETIDHGGNAGQDLKDRLGEGP